MALLPGDDPTLLEYGVHLLDSAFVTSAIGALAGAFAGAWAAQRIAERAKEREQLLQEVKNANAAIELAHDVCNTFLNAKSQCTVPVRTRYEKQRKALHKHIEKRKKGDIPANQRFNVGDVDMRFFPPLGARVEQLVEFVLERVSVSGRPRPLVKTLARSVEQFDHLMTVRNGQIEHVKSLPPMHASEEAAFFMFGLPSAGGVDTAYGDVIVGLDEVADDCIFFSTLLIADLGRHGKRARKIFRRRFRGSVPYVHQLNWKVAKEKGLMLRGINHDTWIKGFKTRIPKTEGRRLSKYRFALRKGLRSPSCLCIASAALFVIATVLMNVFSMLLPI